MKVRDFGFVARIGNCHGNWELGQLILTYLDVVVKRITCQSCIRSGWQIACLQIREARLQNGPVAGCNAQLAPLGLAEPVTEGDFSGWEILVRDIEKEVLVDPCLEATFTNGKL